MADRKREAARGKAGIRKAESRNRAERGAGSARRKAGSGKREAQGARREVQGAENEAIYTLRGKRPVPPVTLTIFIGVWAK